MLERIDFLYGSILWCVFFVFFFFFQAEDGIRDHCVTGVQTCALPISLILMDDTAPTVVILMQNSSKTKARNRC